MHYDVVRTLTISIRTHFYSFFSEKLFILWDSVRASIFTIYNDTIRYRRFEQMRYWRFLGCMSVPYYGLDKCAELLSVLSINFSVVTTWLYLLSIANDDTRRFKLRGFRYFHLLTCILKDSARLNPVIQWRKGCLHSFCSFKSNATFWLLCTETIWILTRHNYKISRLLVTYAQLLKAVQTHLWCNLWEDN